MKTTPLTEEHRRHVFAELVAAQDAGAEVRESRASVATKYGISVEVLKKIEREGLDREWPPL